MAISYTIHCCGKSVLIIIQPLFCSCVICHVDNINRNTLKLIRMIMILQTCKASLSLNFVNDMFIVIYTFVEIVEIRFTLALV